MEEFGQKYSIKVGIIGEKAKETSEGTNLTNAELGAIHEFGATINVTNKMRNYLHFKGLHLNSDTLDIHIPTRSFLRMPLMSSEGKRKIINNVKKALNKNDAFGLNIKEAGNNYNTVAYDKDKDSEVLTYMLTGVANAIGISAVERVMDAFETSGFGKWAPISEFTKKNRQGDKDNPPLNDTGQLRNSISYKVEKQ